MYLSRSISLPSRTDISVCQRRTMTCWHSFKAPPFHSTLLININYKKLVKEYLCHHSHTNIKWNKKAMSASIRLMIYNRNSSHTLHIFNFYVCYLSVKRKYNIYKQTEKKKKRRTWNIFLIFYMCYMSVKTKYNIYKQTEKKRTRNIFLTFYMCYICPWKPNTTYTSKLKKIIIIIMDVNIGSLNKEKLHAYVLTIETFNVSRI